MLITDLPDVSKVYTEIQVQRDGTVMHTLIIETNLVFDEDKPGYDAERLYKFIQSLHRCIEKDPARKPITIRSGS